MSKTNDTAKVPEINELTAEDLDCVAGGGRACSLTETEIATAAVLSAINVMVAQA
jgi:hypothetical protein